MMRVIVRLRIVNPIDRKYIASISSAGSIEKSVDDTFTGVLTNDHTYLSDFWLMNGNCVSLSGPELNAHTGRVPRAIRAVHVAFIITIESKVREDGSRVNYASN